MELVLISLQDFIDKCENILQELNMQLHFIYH